MICPTTSDLLAPKRSTIRGANAPATTRELPVLASQASPVSIAE